MGLVTTADAYWAEEMRHVEVKKPTAEVRTSWEDTAAVNVPF